MCLQIRKAHSRSVHASPSNSALLSVAELRRNDRLSMSAKKFYDEDAIECVVKTLKDLGDARIYDPPRCEAVSTV